MSEINRTLEPPLPPAEPKAATDEKLAEKLAAAERRAWLGLVLVQSVKPPIRVIMSSLDHAVASLSYFDPSGAGRRPLAQAPCPSPDVAFRRLGISLDEAFAAAAYLERMVSDLHTLAYGGDADSNEPRQGRTEAAVR